jgi:HSP20 family molecular chaperone IbpA
MSYAFMGAWENEVLALDYLKRSLNEEGAFGKGAGEKLPPYARHSGDKSGGGGWRHHALGPPSGTDHAGGSEGRTRLEASISDTGGSIVIKAKLPGVELEDIHVELMDNILMLRVEKEREQPPEEEGLGSEGADARAFKKSFVLPDTLYLFPEMIRATFVNGVFRLEILKHG